MAQKKKKKKTNSKELQSTKYLFTCLLIFISVIFLTCIIFKTDLLKSDINQLTASYISFNNTDTTDMLKISTLKKMSDQKGKSKANDRSLDFEITGKKGSDYDIIIYPMKEQVNLERIKYSLSKENSELLGNTLNTLKKSSDGGLVLYQGKITKNNKFHLSMWLTKNYSGNEHNISFEIKVKPR